jgi:hypothetical protein
MYWILQNNLFDEPAYQSLLDTLIRFEIPYSIHKVIPFVGELIPPPALSTNNVICMGSYSLRHAAKQAGWLPGVFDLEPFDFQIQMTHWGNHMLNSAARVMPFRDVKIEQRSFLRPIQDSKAFSGKIYDHYEFHEWKPKVLKLRAGNRTLRGDTLVQVCPIREIYGEYRFWIVKGEIVCASQYKEGTRIVYRDDVPEAYFDFVRAMIAIWQPLEAFVIDVASVPDDGDGWKGIKIVEINTLNSAGFYAADMQKLVMALENNFTD